MIKTTFLSLSLLLLTALPALAAESPETTTETSSRSYESPVNAAVELIFLPASFPSYQWSNGVTNDAKTNGFRVTFEWIPFGETPYGKPVLGFGTGASWFSGLGLSPGISGSLYAFPVDPYVGYRLDCFKNQIIVPFGKVGLAAAYLQEELQVSDGKRQSSQTYLGFDLSAGAEIWLNFIDRRSGRNLDASTGINNVYLLVEYLKSRNLGAKYANLSREEIRFGMRFEF